MASLLPTSEDGTHVGVVIGGVQGPPAAIFRFPRPLNCVRSSRILVLRRCVLWSPAVLFKASHFPLPALFVFRQREREREMELVPIPAGRPSR